MSDEFKVKVVQIKEVLKHPNADRLDLVVISGWQCVSGKGNFKPGDFAVYIPIDSVLPYDLEAKLFPPDAKIKLHKSRVRSIKIRGAISQGMLVPATELEMPNEDGYDCTSKLGITKYEPPTPSHLGGNGPNVGKRTRRKNPYFKEYGGLNNFKWYPDMFKPGDEVVFTEKIHGTNFRFGWIPNVPDTLWKRILKFFGKLPEYEFAFGSNKVQLHNRDKKKKTNFYVQQGAGNVYEEAVETYCLKELTVRFPGIIFYGEIYGSAIQKNYTYGCKEGERRLIGFDAYKVDQDPAKAGFVDYDEMDEMFMAMNLPTAPVLYRGPYSPDHVKSLTLGDSVLAPEQKVREGGVLRPVKEENSHAGRKVLKLISDEYLLRDDNTDFH